MIKSLKSHGVVTLEAFFREEEESEQASEIERMRVCVCVCVCVCYARYSLYHLLFIELLHPATNFA